MVWCFLAGCGEFRWSRCEVLSCCVVFFCLVEGLCGVAQVWRRVVVFSGGLDSNCGGVAWCSGGWVQGMVGCLRWLRLCCLLLFFVVCFFL